MSPKTKKILLIAGAALAGYVVYSRLKKPATRSIPQLSLAQSKFSALKTATLSPIRVSVATKTAGWH